MGVPGLWDILRPAGKQRSLAELAVHDGFKRNPGGRRGLRVGIDASIWFFHATYGREGENPELRTLFFRCARLMSRPFLPLFVFDGPHRPEQKRKKKVSGKDHWMVSGMQEIIEAFGFEWWCAPGEAEAELAYLNRIGVIDAIITDDVDSFLFGATTIIRNPGKMLSGNSAHPVKNSADRDDGEHTYTYSSSDILEYPEISLSQDGLILIALFRGGDYDPDGIEGCGTTVAHALARCGFGEKLLDAARELSRPRLQAFLDGWRNEIRSELRSNSRGFMNTKKLKLAKDLPDTFPDIDVLRLYTHPMTSERKDLRPEFLWNREPDLMKLAALCERKFEWGVREIIIKRFRTVMWAPIVLRIMRRAVLDTDAGGPATPRKKKRINEKDSVPGTPSKMITEHFSSLSVQDEDDTQRLIIGIHGKRHHASTDGMAEYRLEIAPAQLVRLTAAGVQGHRIPPNQYRDEVDDEYGEDIDDEDDDGNKRKTKKTGLKKPPPDPDSHLRVWMPACIVERVEPCMVAVYEGRVAEKEREREEKAARKAARAASVANPKSKSKSKISAKVVTTKKGATRRTEQEEEEEEELSAEEDFCHVFNISSKNKGKATGGGNSRSKGRVLQRLASSRKEEEEEDEDEISCSPLLSRLPSKPAAFAEATNGERLRRGKPTMSPRLSSDISKAFAVSSRGPTTGLSRQKSLLDLLDECLPNSRVVSSIESISSPVKLNPQDKRAPAPKPFPMSIEDKDRREASRMLKCIPAPKLAHTKKTSSRQFSTLKSDSGESSHSILSTPKKSPRKSKKQGSPSNRSQLAREKGRLVLGISTNGDTETITESESDRPVSPSPLRGKSTFASKCVVELTRKTSSAGAFTPVSTTLKSRGSPSFSQPKLAQTEIIEITSSSESEHDMQQKAGVTSAKTKPKKATRTTNANVSSGNVQCRVDSLFPAIKSLPVTKQKTLSSKPRAGSDKKRRPPIYGVDEVIEIL
ncbi:hypothetical protein ACEPAI_1952 [Sanghuangporus weigelae]